MDTTITPEPDEPTRAAILEALAGEPAPRAGAWAAAALDEGVSGDAPDAFEQHDVCSLW